jgi:hypothetical protein
MARRKPAVSMQNRLKHLETLVKDVMAAQSPAAKRAIPSVSGPASGQVVQGMNEVTYVGATHWAAILDDVCFPLLIWCVRVELTLATD